VNSDKSIIGIGPKGAIFNGIGFNVNGKKNIIIRNIVINKGTPDGIAMRNTHHVWIDHCDLSDSNDGLLDYTIGSTYLTVSWTKLHHHDKVSIVNSGTQHFEDAGKCDVTYHHNWFANNVQRNPRIGYGRGHVFNNYYSDISSYCVGYHTGASVLVENNHFYKSKSPLNQMYTSVQTAAAYADAKEVGNIFEATSGNTKGTGTSFNPELYYDYRFVLDSATAISSLVQSKAGTKAGLQYEVLPTPGNGAIDVYASADSLVWTNLEKVSSWEVYFGTSETTLSKTSTQHRSYLPSDIKPGTKYFWKVKALCADTIIESPLWCFTTAPAKASKPFPAHGDLHASLRYAKTAIACSPIEFSWKPGLGAVKYKVYLGENAQLSESDFKAEVALPRYAPGALRMGVTYYWRIDCILSNHSVLQGDVWNFISDIVYATEGDTEVENMVLAGRAYLETQDGSWFKASNNKVVSGEAGPGTMSCVWAGPDANCTVTLSYFDESDGKGWYGFYVNETSIDSWFASSNNDKIVSRVIKNVALRKNDELRIMFYTNNGELNRTDVLDVKVESLLGVESFRTSDFLPNQTLWVAVFALDGKLMKSLHLSADASGKLPEHKMEVTDLSRGVYLMRIQGQNTLKVQTRKIVIR